jgi:uncharacterized membrane protein
MTWLDGTAAPRPSRLQWTWLTLAFFVGLAYLVVIPPFQTNDETHHWIKMYSVSEGREGCTDLPQRVVSFAAQLRFQALKDHYTRFRFADFDVPQPDSSRVPAGGAACGYPSIAYVFPALLARGSQALWPVRHFNLLVAFYAARLGNWLMLTAGVVFVLLAVPLARSWTLVLYSLPMMMHQCMSINQDAAIMAMHCVLVVGFFRTSGWRQLVTVGIAVLFLAKMKPVYGPLALWLLPAAWQLVIRGDARAQRRRIVALACAGGAILFAAVWRALPYIMIERTASLGTPSWTNPGEQIYAIFHHPSILLAALHKQLQDNLGHGHLTGGYVSVLGVFGWCQYELAWPTYRLIFIAAALALVADWARPGVPLLPATRSVGEAIVCRALPALAPILVVLAIDIAFWVMFTEPLAPHIVGVQGRYYHGSIFLVGVGLSSWLARRPWLAWLRRDVVHAVANALALLCFMSVWRDCVRALYNIYW